MKLKWLTPESVQWSPINTALQQQIISNKGIYKSQVSFSCSSKAKNSSTIDVKFGGVYSQIELKGLKRR